MGYTILMLLSVFVIGSIVTAWSSWFPSEAESPVEQ